MNDFLVNALMAQSLEAPEGQRIRELVRLVGEQAAQVAEEHSPAAAWAIRAQFVSHNATDAATAARVALLTPQTV